MSLFLTSLNKVRKEPLVKFTIPSLATTWNKLGLMVRGANVKLFINCEHVETLSVSRPQVANAIKELKNSNSFFRLLNLTQHHPCILDKVDQNLRSLGKVSFR